VIFVGINTIIFTTMSSDEERTGSENQKPSLLSLMAPYLDIHLLNPILNFYRENEVFPEKEVLKAQLDILKQTYMVNYAMDIYKELNNTEEDSEELVSVRNEVIELLQKRETAAKPLLELPQLDHYLALPHCNFQWIHEHHQISEDDVWAVYWLALFRYNIGDYESAAKNLGIFCRLQPPSPPKTAENSVQKPSSLSALWGLLGAQILSSDWDAAEKELNAIKEKIDDTRGLAAESGSGNVFLEQLRLRVWWCHWGLFVYFNRAKGLEALLDICFGQERYLRSVQLQAPWLLRYYCIATVITQHRLKDVTRAVDEIVSECGNDKDSSVAEDPFVQFVLSLYSECDLLRAEELIETCEEELRRDYFVAGGEIEEYITEWVRQARYGIAATYCQTHSTLHLPTMSKLIQLDEAATERWVVQQIRASQLNATIDSARKLVLIAPMNHARPSSATPDGSSSLNSDPFTQLLISRTQALIARTDALSSTQLPPSSSISNSSTA
jgi:translation initiation factor 3 subunit E